MEAQITSQTLLTRRRFNLVNICRIHKMPISNRAVLDNCPILLPFGPSFIPKAFPHNLDDMALVNFTTPEWSPRSGI